MAKPNYQFEKRQRDLAKKQKQEEKRLQKLAGKAAADGTDNLPASSPESNAPAGMTAPAGEAPGPEAP